MQAYDDLCEPDYDEYLRGMDDLDAGMEYEEAARANLPECPGCGRIPEWHDGRLSCDCDSYPTEAAYLRDLAWYEDCAMAHDVSTSMGTWR